MILVFKTSVQKLTQVRQLSSSLDAVALKDRWNFDLQDVDRILRLDVQEDITEIITTLLNEKGFFCAALD